MASLIRWRKEDYRNLRNAINKFNYAVEKLENEGSEYLPDFANYKAIKGNITSRRELNRVIKSLRSANYDNLRELIEFESGEKLTKWENRQLKLARNRALKNLELERQTIMQDQQSIGMGDERLSEIRAIEKSFTNIGTRKGSDFSRIKKRVFSIGRSDYRLARDKQFMENFYKALEGISNFQNYDILKRELDKIKNPSKFYEYVKKSPVLMDLFLWYKESDTLFYGGFSNNQDAFDSALMFHLGIEDVDVGI